MAPLTARITPMRAAALTVALTLMVAACGSSPGPASGSQPPGSPSPAAASPTQSASPAVSPSASPSAPPSADVVTLVSARIGHATFAAKTELTGQLVVGGETFDISGTGSIRGRSSDTTITIDGPSGTTITQARTVAGTSYSRTGDGPWFASTASSTGSVGIDFGTLRDAGPDTFQGQPAHRLVPTKALTPKDAGFGSATGTVTVALYATEDGTPLGVVVTADWGQVVDGKATPARATLEMRLTCLGCSVEIVAPHTVFATQTSKKLGYAVAVPDDWDAQLASSTKKPDAFFGPDDQMLFVYRYPTSGYTLNTRTSTYIRVLKGGTPDVKKFKLDKQGTLTVDGQRARSFTYHATVGGEKVYVVVVLVSHKGKVDEFDLLAPTGDEAAERTLMNQIASTVDLR